MNELEILFPETQTLLVQDREVDVSPLKIGEVPRVLKALRGVVLPLRPSGAGASPPSQPPPEGGRSLEPPPSGRGQGEGAAFGDGDSVDVLALLSGEHGEAALDAVSIACRQPREWLDQLAVDEAIQLAFNVVEVNADFFVRRVLPALTSGMEKLPQAIGPT